ncbi:MAG: hypothetical protein MJ180_00060 [Candidatus Gastranaerophilales bacterium]|nr:hypothetical protein [Candidatus Gastranaerophilales bacterium]
MSLTKFNHIIYNAINDVAREEIDDDRTYWNITDKNGKFIDYVSWREQAEAILKEREEKYGK